MVDESTVGNIPVGTPIEVMGALKRNPKAVYLSLGFN